MSENRAICVLYQNIMIDIWQELKGVGLGNPKMFP